MSSPFRDIWDDPNPHVDFESFIIVGQVRNIRPGMYSYHKVIILNRWIIIDLGLSQIWSLSL